MNSIALRAGERGWGGSTLKRGRGAALVSLLASLLMAGGGTLAVAGEAEGTAGTGQAAAVQRSGAARVAAPTTKAARAKSAPAKSSIQGKEKPTSPGSSLGGLTGSMIATRGVKTPTRILTSAGAVTVYTREDMDRGGHGTLAQFLHSRPMGR